MSARVRIYIPTYQRAVLLKRALESLVAQTFSDWIAEVHNDDPDDVAPKKIVGELCDPRIQLVWHETNKGALQSFNEFFSCQNDEEFVSLLEDDNAWEPEFLEQMVGIMDSDKSLSMAWCNQWLDEETVEGKVVSLGRTARQAGAASWLKGGKFLFEHPAQAFGALHANGAMLFRRKVGGPLVTPSTIPFTGVEPFRERMLAGSIFYFEGPLARFTITKSSARGGEDFLWASFQTGLIASYLLSRTDAASGILCYARQLRPAATGSYISACLAHEDLRSLLGSITLQEWLRWTGTAIWRPKRTRACLTYANSDWWIALLEITMRRGRENRLAE